MYYLGAFFFNENNLRLVSQGENRGVSESIFCFEIIGIKKVVMRNMTTVAIGYFAVRTVTPGCVLGAHNVAVDTGLGIVRQIGVCF
jgi:hypothetical protein